MGADAEKRLPAIPCTLVLGGTPMQPYRHITSKGAIEGMSSYTDV